MSIVKFKDLKKFDTETIKLALKSIYNVDFKRACNSPKYLVIDWSGVSVEDIDLSNVDDYYLSEYCFDCSNINNREVLSFFIKKTDAKDPELLWILLVDDNNISDSLYQKNSFDENMDILMKITKFNLPIQ